VDVLYANYAVWAGGSGGPKNDFFPVGAGIPQWEGVNFAWKNRTVQCNTKRENVALQCRCGIPAAEWVDSSAVGIAHYNRQRVSWFSAMRGHDAALPKLLWDCLTNHSSHPDISDSMRTLQSTSCCTWFGHEACLWAHHVLKVLQIDIWGHVVAQVDWIDSSNGVTLYRMVKKNQISFFYFLCYFVPLQCNSIKQQLCPLFCVTGANLAMLMTLCNG